MAKGPPIPPELLGPSEEERQIRAQRMAKANSDMKGRLVSVSAIGTEFAIVVAGGGLLGWVIDKLAGTEPWGILIGFGFGLVYGFTRFVKEALALSKPKGKTKADGSPKDDAR